ncbi:MAG: hypothetical protein QME70_06295 [Bacillota bacterium]|nr:hypothetical protein [Bacillota bacterium]
MDWARAKNILIVAFLGVNLLLGYRLWTGPATASSSLYTVGAREVREVAAQLRERGVVLAAEIPRRARPLALLTVSNPPVEPAAVAARFLGPGAEVVQEGDVWLGLKGQEAVVVYPGGEVFYRRLPRPGAQPGGTPPSAGKEKPPDPDRAVQAARDFWGERGGLPTGADLDYHAPAGAGRYLVVFTCQAAGHRFFGGRAAALVGPGGVEEAYGAFPLAEKPSGNPRPILPATEALLRAAPLLVEKGAVVVQVEEGYYSPVYDAREWEAVPVWRVRLGSGASLYVNAYTGEPEGKDEPFPRNGQEIFAYLQKQGTRTK